MANLGLSEKMLQKHWDIKNANDAISKHVDSEDKGVAKRDTLGGSQNMIIINESGMYALVLSS